MLKEVVHFLRHFPGLVRLSRRMSQTELYIELMERAERAGVAEWRARVASGLSGRVLEIGCGTGMMFPHYAEGLDVVAIELRDDFLDAARGPAAKAKADITLEAADAEALPYEDGSFDAVIVAGVLCSVDHPDRALTEIRRVLKPDGEVRLIEHIKSPRAVPGLLMDLFNPAWLLVNRQGCHMNRRTDQTIRDAGFELVDREAFQIFVDGLPAFPSLFMRARPAASAGDS